MTATFRIEDGIAFVGDKSYPWAESVHAPDGWPWQGFGLNTENAWRIEVMWHAEEPAWDSGPLFEPHAMVAAVDCCAVGLLHQLSIHNPEKGAWPHGTPFNWSMPRMWIVSSKRLDEIVAWAATQFSPPWLKREVV